MKKILILNGPNLNMLGRRDKNLYGDLGLKNIEKLIKKEYREYRFKFIQTNSEEKIINILHKYNKYSYILINAGAFSHYSYAIYDALELVSIPVIGIHLSNIENREEFRKKDILQKFYEKTFIGFKHMSYIYAIEYIIDKYLK